MANELVEGSLNLDLRCSRYTLVKLFVLGCFLSCLTNFPSAFTHTSMNTAVIEVSDYFNSSFSDRGNDINADHIAMLRSLYSSSWYAGQVFGALCSPWFTDVLGRRPAYMISTLAMTIACAIQSAATMFSYPEALILGRVLASAFSPMSDAVLILYLQETSPTEIRGVLSSLFATGYSVMALLGMIFGIPDVFGDSLPTLNFIPVIPGIIGLVVLYYLPETPKFLMITKKDRVAAKKSLDFYQGKKISNEIILDDYLCEAKNEATENGELMDLVRVPYLRKALILAFVVTILTLAFYPILQSSTFFLYRIGIADSISEYASTGLMIALVISCIVATFLLKKFGRRTLLIFFGIGSILSLCLFVGASFYIKHFPILKYFAFFGLLGYVICYGLAIGPISYFIGPELVPLKHRSTIYCAVFSLNSALVVLTNFYITQLYTSYGPITFIPFFIVPSLGAVIYVYIDLPETKDRETHEIVGMLRNGHRYRINPQPGILDLSKDKL